MSSLAEINPTFTSLKRNYCFAQLLDHVDAPAFDSHHCASEWCRDLAENVFIICIDIVHKKKNMCLKFK